jgi:TolB protein
MKTILKDITRIRKTVLPWGSFILVLLALTFTAESPRAGARLHRQQPGGGPGSIAFHSARDGHANNQIYVMDPDGSNQTRITDDLASDTDPNISTNGRAIVFTSSQPGNNDIFVLDQSGLITNLTNNPANDGWARWSPNGKQIVFESNRDGAVFEIYIMNADGSGTPMRLTELPVMSRYGSWSPDGKEIAFRRGIDISVANADGSDVPRQLTSETAPSFAQMPVFSPNGKYIAFMSFREGYCSVFRMNADGSEQTNLTPRDPAVPPATWCSRAPSWSADGREIFFMSSRTGQNEIFAMNMDGTNVHQLTFTGTSGSPSAR